MHDKICTELLNNVCIAWLRTGLKKGLVSQWAAAKDNMEKLLGSIWYLAITIVGDSCACVIPLNSTQVPVPESIPPFPGHGIHNCAAVLRGVT